MNQIKTDVLTKIYKLGGTIAQKRIFNRIRLPQLFPPYLARDQQENAMTEFEELALKKMTKDYLVDCIYSKVNALAGHYGISNADISKRVGWDPAGFNQKYNRSNDLRITTFIKIYVALVDLISEREAEMEMGDLGLSKIGIDELITKDEIELGMLFNHISAAAEGNADFLNSAPLQETFSKMKAFVLLGKRNQRFSDRETGVYVQYYKKLKG